MNTLLDTEFLQSLLDKSLAWLTAHVFTLGTLLQFITLLVVLLLARFLGNRLYPFLDTRLRAYFEKQAYLRSLFDTLLLLIPALHVLVFTSIAKLIFNQVDVDTLLLSLVINLLLAWAVIKLAAAVILDRFWSLTVTVAAWSLAALNIIGVLDPMVDFLDSFGFTLGEVRLTFLSVAKALFLFFLALRLGVWISDYLDRQMNRMPNLTPSARVLISKTIRITMYVIVGVVALNSVGINLTGLAVFSGAVGVGIGFGLQKVVSNLISGIILLTDRSIKPGDVIQIGNVYGWISSLRGRYVSVVTRDGHEYLIPNEDLITQQVVNWSYSDRKVRLHAPVGISYKSDVRKAMDLMLESATSVDRVLKHPKPICLLTGFGDSSVDLELRFWIEDPQNGIQNVKSAVMLNIWDRFHDNGIEIPFPQRDVHLNTKNPVPVNIQPSPEADA